MAGVVRARQLHNLYASILSCPVLAIFLLALAVRLVVAVISNTLQDGVLIPDEMSYIRIADLGSTGDLGLVPTQRCLEFAVADGTQYYCGYWRGLFASTRTFSWPLTALFWMFGPHRILGQFLAGLAGAVAAAITGRLAMEFLREPFGIGAGTVVALLPSQVLYSSVALRESTIWLLLAGVGVVVSLSKRHANSGGVLLSSLGLGVLFVLLAWLRLQTAVLALWCAVPVFVMVGRNRVLRVLCAAGLVLIGPMLVGAGPAASGLVGGSLDRLGYSRDVMSAGAVTAFDYPQGSSEVGQVSGSSEVGQAGVLSIIERGAEGESLIDSVLIVPSGLYNTMIRPVIWSKTDLQRTSVGHLLATLESPLWVVGYLFAGFGAYSLFLRREMSFAAFPLLFTFGIAFSGAVTHGNLGTAFRHRGQIVFALAVLAAAGVQAVSDGRKRSGGHNGDNRMEQLDGIS